MNGYDVQLLHAQTKQTITTTSCTATAVEYNKENLYSTILVQSMFAFQLLNTIEY